MNEEQINEVRHTGKAWSESEDKFLRSAVESGNRPKEIAKHLKRTEKSVEYRISYLKLKVKDNGKAQARLFDLADVKCPFFERFYRGKSIKCEGIGREGSYIINGFGTESEWINHVNMYCNVDWDVCPVAVMLSDKFG